VVGLGWVGLGWGLSGRIDMRRRGWPHDTKKRRQMKKILLAGLNRTLAEGQISHFRDSCSRGGGRRTWIWCNSDDDDEWVLYTLWEVKNLTWMWETWFFAESHIIIRLLLLLVVVGMMLWWCSSFSHINARELQRICTPKPRYWFHFCQWRKPNQIKSIKNKNSFVPSFLPCFFLF
jgi:hypothetical protein